MQRDDVDLRTYLPANVVSDMSWLPAKAMQNLPKAVALRPGRLFQRLNEALTARRQMEVWGSLAEGVFLATYYSTYPNLKVAQITVIHDMIYELFPDLTLTPRQEYHKQEKAACIAAANLIVCPSASARRDVEAFFDVSGKTLCVIPWGVELEYRPSNDLDRIRAFSRRSTSGAPYLLYVGGRDGTKNFTPLLMAFARWAGRKDVHLLAVGGGPFNNQEHALLRALRLRGVVHCVPALPNQELVVAYSGAVGCVMPSLYEGFGFPVLEAMACGTPVAASNASSLPEVGGDVAVYFDPTDNDAMLAALCELTDISKRADRVSRGINRAREFTWERAVDQLVVAAECLR